jgi:tetratricopeptide (TPR) repeat protein
VAATAGLVALLLVLHFASPQAPNPLAINKDMVSLVREASTEGLGICDYPEGLVGGLWQRYQELLLSQNIDVNEARSGRLLALYNKNLLAKDADIVEQEYGVGLSSFVGFFFRLVTSCTNTPEAERADRTKFILDHASGSEGAQVLGQLGLFFFQERLWSEAQPVYEELVARNPDDGENLWRLGAVYRGVGDYERAAHYLKRSLDKPVADQVKSLVLLGNSYFYLGDYEQALTTLLQARSALQNLPDAHPTAPEVYFNLGLVWQKLGNFDEAIRSHEAAVQLEPNYDASLTRLARLLLATKDLTAAEFYSDRLAATTRLSDSALCLLFQVKTAVGKAEEAQAWQARIDAAQIDCSIYELDEEGLGPAEESEARQ